MVDCDLGTPVKGYLGTEARNISGGTVEYRREHYYDNHLRSAGHRTEVQAESGLESFAIDIANDRYFGRPKSMTRFAGTTAQGTVTYGYDALGNIQRKSDFAASYSYSQNIPFACSGAVAAGPHAVTHAGTRQYAYDANGNLRCGNAAAGNLSAEYDAFNLPLGVTRSGASTTFLYGSDN